MPSSGPGVEEFSTLDPIYVHALFIVPPILGFLWTLRQWIWVKAIKITEMPTKGTGGELLDYTPLVRQVIDDGAKQGPDTDDEVDADRMKIQEPQRTLLRLSRYSQYISDGANAFLFEEYRWMSLFVVFMSFVIMGFYWGIGKPNLGLYTTISFIVGAVTSIISGYIGMQAAVMCNARTTYKVWISSDFPEGLDVAMRGGSIMGFGLCSLGVAVLYALVMVYRQVLGTEDPASATFLCEALAGFGLGGSSIALFGRVGGGIYTKAADVGADLSGKIGYKIKEDDPRNPACIADNVGDNVGDIAGMGADLFGSFAESTVAALVIASKSEAHNGVDPLGGNFSGLYFPVLVSSSGIAVGIVTMLLVLCRFRSWCQHYGMNGIEATLKFVLIVSTVLQTPVIIGLAYACLPDKFALDGRIVTPFACIVSLLLGLWAGLAIGIVTEMYTSHSYESGPVRVLAKSQTSAAATGIIYGLALGYESCVIPVLTLAGVIVVAHSMVGMYGVALGALGMLSTLTLGLTVDAYGPISDNAGGICEMADLPKEVRDFTDALDAAGNTTAAIGKGFAIGSAALVALALFGAFKVRAGLQVVDVTEEWTFSGLLIGALLPFAFSAMTMKSVSLAADQMVEECQNQFPKILGIGDDGKEVKKEKAQYNRCIMISTKASLREMIKPGLLVILSPLVMGILFGKNAVAGLLSGSLVSGVQLAISMSNSGGAWDNAKKFFKTAPKSKSTADATKDKWFVENQVFSDTESWSSAHENAITGDTVGDPLKDTSGPSLNILVKLSAITSLVFASVVSHTSNPEGGPMFTMYFNQTTE